MYTWYNKKMAVKYPYTKETIGMVRDNDVLFKRMKKRCCHGKGCVTKLGGSL